MKRLALLAILCSSCISPTSTVPYMQTEAFASYMRSTQDKPKFKKDDKVYLVDAKGKKYIGHIHKVGSMGVWVFEKTGERRTAREYTVSLRYDGKVGLMKVPGFLLKKRK